MQTYLKHIADILLRLFIVLICYSLCRGLFYLMNQSAFSSSSVQEVIRVFVYGVRFDYSALIQFNGIFLIAYLLPFDFARTRRYTVATDIGFVIVNSLLLLINLGDTEYFKYTGKRSTADLFKFIFMSDDTAVLLPQFIHDFWYIVLVWLAFTFGGILVYRRFSRVDGKPYGFSRNKLLSALLIFALTAGFLFLGARGTGLKPIRIISAARYTSTQNIPLMLNTPFCIIHTLRGEGLLPKRYLNDALLAESYTPEQQRQTAGAERTDNVVVIILESFSKEFIGALNNGKGYTPNLDQIISEGLVFENAFANGKKSIEALPAIFAGIPSLMDDPYVSSSFSGNTIMALPAILAAKGYHTSFFHGGRNGTMGFDEFAHLAGITHYFGLNEYRGTSAFDGKWGIFDEEFLHFFAGQLNSFPEPFFSSVFTLSSHHPYTVPERYKEQFDTAPTPLLRSIRYADHALGQFFRTISKYPWYTRTLFIFVADHTAVGQSAEYATRAGIYRVPLIFFHPGNHTLHGTNARITQQTDIMPSVLDFLNINRPFLAFGSSVFDKQSRGFAVNYLGGIYQYFENDHLLSFDGEKSTALYRLNDDPMLNNNKLNISGTAATDMEQRLKAIIQQYNNRMLSNSLTIKNR